MAYGSRIQIMLKQGDKGHKSADVLTNVYGHILDERRKENAKLFDQFFPPLP